MSILTNQQKTKIYEKELWEWRGKMIPLKYMDTNMLDVCLKYIKKYPKGTLNGKNKTYWVDAIEHLIRVKSSYDVKTAISKIQEHRVLKANQKVSNMYSMFRDNTILGKIKLFENQLKTK